MAWEKLKSDDVSKRKNVGTCRAVIKRIFKEGSYREYPRLTIGIFEKDNKINIGISKKNDADDPWKNTSLPSELAGELAEMLVEYSKSKPKKINNYLGSAC